MTCDAEFDVGDVVTVSVQWATNNGIAINPSTVTLVVKDPAGTKTTYTTGFAQPSLGRYEHDIPAAVLPGRWFYRWEAGGTLIAAEEGEYRIRQSRVL